MLKTAVTLSANLLFDRAQQATVGALEIFLVILAKNQFL